MPINTGFVEVSAMTGMALSPSGTRDLQKSVKEVLSQMLLKYDESLEGVVLAFHGTELIGSAHPVFEETPYVHVRVKANYVLFKPVVGTLLGRNLHIPYLSIILN